MWFCYSREDKRENNLPTNLLKSYSTPPATCIMESALKMGLRISRFSHVVCYEHTWV